MFPLVFSQTGSLGPGSQVNITNCGFFGFTNGTFFIESFESDNEMDSQLLATGSMFVNNTGVSPSLVSSFGCCAGAIDIDSAMNGTVSITSSAFMNNTSTGSGGAVRVSGIPNSRNGPTVSIAESEFEINTANFGGAVFINSTLALAIRDSAFTNNIATNRGGGLFAGDLNQSYTCETTNFTDNVAGTDGGGASTFNVGDVNYTSNEFVRNVAASQGGGFFALDQTNTFPEPLFTFVDNDFTNNTASSFPNLFVLSFRFV